MDKKFSSKKLSKRIEKYMWQPSTKELGNPLYRKGIDETLHTEEQKQDKEFLSEIEKHFTSPNNVRALFLFTNFAITVLHYGMGTNITKKDESNTKIERSDNNGKVLEEHAIGKNLISIKAKEGEKDKLLFGIRQGDSTDKDGKTVVNFEYEEIPVSNNVNSMDIVQKFKTWQMRNIEEIYFDIMYVLNKLDGSTEDVVKKGKKIDLDLVVKAMFQTEDLSQIKVKFPRLKYIGFTMDENLYGYREKLKDVITEAQKERNKYIIEQIPELKKIITKGVELGGTQEAEYVDENKNEWIYDWVFTDVNVKKNIAKQNQVKQEEAESLKGYRDVTEKFMSLWNNTDKNIVKKVVVRKPTTEKAKSYPSEVDKEYPLVLFDVVQTGSKNLVVIEDKSYTRLEKKSYLSDNYNFEEGKDTGLFSIREGVKYAVIQIPPEEKVYVRRNGFVYKLNVKASNGDYLVCRMVNGEPVSTEVWVETGLWFDTYYEEYVKEEELPENIEITKKYIADIVKTDKQNEEKLNLITGMITMNLIAPDNNSENVKKNIELLLYRVYKEKILDDNNLSMVAIKTIDVLKRVNKYIGDISIKDYFNKGE